MDREPWRRAARCRWSSAREWRMGRRLCAPSPGCPGRTRLAGSTYPWGSVLVLVILALLLFLRIRYPAFGATNGWLKHEIPIGRGVQDSRLARIANGIFLGQGIRSEEHTPELQ